MMIYQLQKVAETNDMDLTDPVTGAVAGVIFETDTPAGMERAKAMAAGLASLASLKRLVRLLEVEDAHLANFGEVEEARTIIKAAEA